MVELDVGLLVAAISALFGSLASGSLAVIRHLMAENRALLQENKALREDGVALAKSAIAALDKLGSK